MRAAPASITCPNNRISLSFPNLNRMVLFRIAAVSLGSLFSRGLQAGSFFQLVTAVSLTEDLTIWVLGGRALSRLRAHRGFRVAFHGFMALQTFGAVPILLGWVLGYGADALCPTPLFVVLAIWHVVVAPIAVVGLLSGTLGEAIWAVGRRLLTGRSPSELAAAESSPAMTRREFLGTAAVLSPPLLTLGLSAVAGEQLSRFRIREIDVRIPQLPRALDGLTIAHVSDIHIGRFTHGAVVRRAVEATNALKADLVLFTGDLINDSLRWLPEGLAMLSGFDRPLFLCEGNHDLIDDGDEFEFRVKKAGHRLLVNEAQTVSVRGVPVQLLGLRWGGPPNYGRRRQDERELKASMRELMALREPKAFPILLAHHPHAWDYAGDIPLTLAGHTHGGQLMLNERLGFGPAMFRYWSGLYTRTVNRKGQSMVVSNGVGNWFPLRTAAPAEIVKVRLFRG